MTKRTGLAVVGLLVCAASFALAWEPKHNAESPEQLLVAVQKYYPAVRKLPAAQVTVESLSGEYIRGIGLRGGKLYLFSDSTYLFTNSDEFTPETIHERGDWRIEKGFVILKSDGSLPGANGLEDHVDAPLGAGPADVPFLMGSRYDFSRFLEKAESDGPGMFQISTMHRKAKPAKDAQQELKRRLMAEAWKPQYFEEAKHQ